MSPGFWPLGIAAALLVAVGFGIGAIALRPGTTDGTPEYSGPIAGSGGAGELSVVETGIGRVIEINTSDLEILPTGEYYEVWFVGPGDAPVTPNRISAGTFHPDADGISNVTLAVAVNPVLYPLVEITAEPGDGNPTATGPVVLSANITSE